MAVLALATIVLGQLAAAAVNAATSQQRWPGPLDTIRANPFVASGILTIALIATTAVGLWWQQRQTRQHGGSAPPLPEPPRWAVARPAELDLIVRELRGHVAETAGTTVGLYGAGGFGKTTLAQLVYTDPRVRQRFNDRIYLVTIGPDATEPAAVATKVNEMIVSITGSKDEAYGDNPEITGGRLGQILDGCPPMLLILDDVWEEGQIAPFLRGGRRSVRLVTTRDPTVLPDGAVRVRVDQMSPGQARQLLTRDLTGVPATAVDELLTVTGRWPLLLRLVNRALVDEVDTGMAVATAAAGALDRLRRYGPTAVDDSTAAPNGLARSDRDRRRRLVRATIEASTRRLAGAEPARLAELGIFPEGEAVPVAVVVTLWAATAGMGDVVARQLCRRLARLSLVEVRQDVGGTIAMHGAVRAYLRRELGDRLAEVNRILLGAVAEGLPEAAPLTAGVPAAQVAWWDLARDERYLRKHLLSHMIDAGETADAEAVAGDVRWVRTRLERSELAEAVNDLNLLRTPSGRELAAGFTRVAHLLAPTQPPGCVADVLASRLWDDPAWGTRVRAAAAAADHPMLVNRWPLPDLPHPAIRRKLVGHDDRVNAVAIFPHRTDLVSVSKDGTVRLWNTATGRQPRVLTGHTEAVNAVAVAPDGTWLATASDDHTVRIWDATTGKTRAVLTGHDDGVNAVAIAPDGTWLATAGDDRTIRIWDAATAVVRAVLPRQTGGVWAVAIAPDGTWLATAGDEGIVRIWNVAASGIVRTLTGHRGCVNGVAIAPDGTWLATAGDDHTVRIWDATTGEIRAELTGHTGRACAVAISPDGTWLASAGSDDTVRTWDVATARARSVLTGHTDLVWAVAIASGGAWLATAGNDRAVLLWDATTPGDRRVPVRHTGWVHSVAAAPDGTWLATAGEDGTAHVWDAATGNALRPLAGHAGNVWAAAVAPDGGWVATASDDGTTRIWDAATGEIRAVLAGHAGRVHDVAIAPEGTWLATVGEDRTVRIWDAGNGHELRALPGHADWVYSVAISPDGTWLATAGGDRSLRIWDAATGETRAVLTGHTDVVNSVAISPDGTWLATASIDRSLRIWDAATGRAELMMRVDGALSGCAWLRDNQSVAVTGESGIYLFGMRRPRGRRDRLAWPAPATGHGAGALDPVDHA